MKMFKDYIITVSYTHLDVYKRQVQSCINTCKLLFSKFAHMNVFSS